MSTIIKQIFSDFSKNQYHYQLESLPASASLAEQLRSVKSYAQPGNIDLWAALPDETPRELCFKVSELKQTKWIPTQSIHGRMGKKSGIRFLKKEKNSSANEFFWAWMIIFGFFIVLGVGYFVADYLYSRNDYYDNLDDCKNKYDLIIQRGAEAINTLDDVPCDRACAKEQREICYGDLLHVKHARRIKPECELKYDNTIKSGTRKKMQEHIVPCDEVCAKEKYKQCLKSMNISDPSQSFKMDYSSYNLGNLGLVYWILMFNILVLLAGVVIKLIRWISGQRKKKFIRFKFREEDAHNLEALLVNGRKSIGIVTNIKYLPTYKGDSEQYFYTDDSGEKSGFYCHHLPLFELSYKFNPIDDASPYDLVHKIIIHEQPGERLKAGNPIPILYLIDKYDKSLVQSMPYPFPMDSIVQLMDLYDISMNHSGVSHDR